MIISFRTDRSGQTVQTQIRLLLEEQSDQGLHCLLFHLHLLEAFLCCKTSLFEFLGEYISTLDVRKFRNFTVITESCCDLCCIISSMSLAVHDIF